MTATTTMAAMFTNVPNDLKELDQWVLWKYVTREGRSTKVPYQTNGEPANTTDPSTWASLEEVEAAYCKIPKRWSGIGLAPTWTR